MGFSYALVQQPARSVISGLRMKWAGDVNYERAKEEHGIYCRILRDYLGLTLIWMPSNEKYPDGVFVEDPAVIVKDMLILARLRRDERRGEETAIHEVLGPLYRNVARIEEPGFLEGGDLVMADGKIFAGISERTNEEGVDQLARIAHNFCGWITFPIEVPKHFLHLKGQVSFHHDADGSPFFIAHEEIADQFEPFGRVIRTPAEEKFGANCISLEEKMLAHSGKPKTLALLKEKTNLKIVCVPLGQFELIDGAMSCLSKIFER